MPGQWREVARLRFTGKRFRDHALDLAALTELSQFQRMVAETAKALWRAAHPDRERLPAHFDEKTRLCLRRIEEGSAVAPLEVLLDETEDPELFESEPEELAKAVSLARTVFRAVATDQPLPEALPKVLLGEYGRLGQTLQGDDETIELEVPSEPGAATITSDTRARIEAIADRAYEAFIDISGEIVEADVRQRRFQLWIDEKMPILGVFPPDLEERVTDALREHRSTRVHVKGRGEFSAQGRPLRITRVEVWEVLPGEGQAVDQSAPTVESLIEALGADVPSDEWRKIPPDLGDNLDHYLYGAPKR